MKITCTETTIHVITESDLETGWVRSVLGLKKDGDTALVTFVGGGGLPHWLAYLEIKRAP